MRDFKYMETGICALCGKDVRLNDEGRVECEGCNRATDNCTCVADDLDTRHESPGKSKSMRKGTSGQWKADPSEGHSEAP